MTNYALNENVPVNGFWLISLYNAEGYYEERLRRLLAQQQHGKEAG